jgi:putative phage-type endonuclease
MTEEELPQDTDVRRRFLEARQRGIGASDAAAILNLSPWGTPLSVYTDKVEPIGEMVSGSLPMWLGQRLEDVVAELFTARTGLKARGDNRQHSHPEDPWLVCHLDYRVWGKPDELIECKTQNSRVGWGEDGSADVPVYYWVQAQHELLVTGAQVCHMPVLFGLYEFRTFRVERDEEFMTRWRQAAKDFWHDHVLAGVPPPLGGDAFSRRVVSSRWPEHDDVLKRLPPERELVILRLREEMAKLKEQEVNVETLKNRVKDLIGEAAGVEGAWGKVTWKQIKDRVFIEWERVADVYALSIREILDHVNPGDDEDAVRVLAASQAALNAAESLYTRVEPGYRRIDVRFKKDG